MNADAERAREVAELDAFWDMPTYWRCAHKTSDRRRWVPLRVDEGRAVGRRRRPARVHRYRSGPLIAKSTCATRSGRLERNLDRWAGIVGPKPPLS